MVDNTEFTRKIGQRIKYTPHKSEKPVSYYKIYNIPQGQGLKRQLRVSNHGTFLRTWLSREYDPTNAINISIVFTKEGVPTNDCLIDPQTLTKFVDCNLCLTQQSKEGNVCKPRIIKEIGQKKRPFFVEQFVYNCQNLEDDDFEIIMNAIKYASINGTYIDPFEKNEEKKSIYTRLYPSESDNSSYKPHYKITKRELKQMINECIREVISDIRLQPYP